MADHSIESTEQHNDHDGHEDHGGVGKYLMVFVALCVLTGASFFTCSDLWPFQDTPSVGWAFMMAVSCTKAMLVILFFMHLIWEANWKYVLTIPAALMSCFLALMLVPDVGCRTNRYSEERMLHAADPVEHDIEHDEHGAGHSEAGEEHGNGHGGDHQTESH